MKPTRTVSRRSFLRKVAGGGAGLISVTALTGCATTGYTDSDPFDPIGGGRWGGGGITDADTGAYADPPGRGRGSRGGYSDNDPSDPPGRGRGGGYSDNDPTDPAGGGGGVCTDSDRGRDADPSGQGRDCRGYTDNDKGPEADPPGRGRGPR